MTTENPKQHLATTLVGLKTRAKYLSKAIPLVPWSKSTMLPAKVACPVRYCCLKSGRKNTTAVFVLLLLLSATMACALSTTLEDDFHIVHKLDNKSPEIDPFLYVRRGVRPIGRFGKREAGCDLRPAINHLQLLLHSLRNRDVQSQDKILAEEDYHRFP